MSCCTAISIWVVIGICLVVSILQCDKRAPADRRSRSPGRQGRLGPWFDDPCAAQGAPSVREGSKKMAEATLTISSKNYSSWSLRGWLLVKMAGPEIEEIVLPADDPSTRAELLLLSPSFLVP